MSRVDADIDIDFADRDQALSGLMHIVASRYVDGSFVRHPTSVYFQDIPTHPFTGISAIPFKETAELGYFKVDFLNNSIYEGIRDEAHLDELLNREPEWSLLQDRDIASLFAHVGEHYGVLQQIKPQSIEDLAVVLALIRPGKKHLLFMPRAQIDAEIWQRDGDNYSFRKAHAIAYAASIVVQMNLMVEKMTEELAAPF